jgi:hypothetical protein
MEKGNELHYTATSDDDDDDDDALCGGGGLSVREGGHPDAAAEPSWTT